MNRHVTRDPKRLGRRAEPLLARLRRAPRRATPALEPFLPDPTLAARDAARLEADLRLAQDALAVDVSRRGGWDQ